MHTYRHISYFLFVLGCQDGLVKMIKYQQDHVWTKDAIDSIQLDGPISSALFSKIDPGATDLILASAVGYVYVAHEVIANGFSKKVLIPNAAEDAITCMTTLDIDFDGQKELLLGTYDNTLLAYKLSEGSFTCCWSMKFMHPVMCLRPLDINRDGVIELILISMFGICVLVPDHSLALTKILALKRSLDN